MKRARNGSDLQCEQRSLVVDVPLDVSALLVERLHVRLDVGEVLVPAPGVDDEVDVLVGDLGDDGVVDGASLLGGEDGERAGAVPERRDVGDDEGLEERDGVAAPEAEAAHVGHVEEAPVGAAVDGGVHDGVPVLDGHAPAGERHHLAAVGDVEVVQRRLLQLGLRRLRRARQVADARGRGGGGAAGEGGARKEAPHLGEPRHGSGVVGGELVVRALVAKGSSRFGGDDGSVSDQ